MPDMITEHYQDPPHESILGQIKANQPKTEIGMEAIPMAGIM